MKKRFFQVCSFFLCIALLISMLPMGVFAEELQEAVANAQSATESTETTEVLESSETYVVDELVEKRTEFSKEFLLSNGLHMAAVYADAVHYETDSGWEEIDNTLKTNADGTLSNTAGVWDVSFPQQLTEEDSITIEKDGYTLSFSMAGELTASGAALMTVGLDEEVVPFSVTEVQTSNAQVQESDTTAMEEAAEYPETVPDKVQSQVSYADVYENTDVVYDLNSNQVKESIILESYSEALQGYRYTLDVGTMIPVLEEDGQITFYDADRENVVLVMPAPYLVDDAGAYNDEIQVQLTGSGSSYTMLYILPQQWLAAEERAWPVVLDPIVEVDMRTKNICDKTICEKREYPNQYILDTGYYSSNGIMRSYLKYEELPTLTSSDVVVSATVRLYKAQNSASPAVIEVHKVNRTWGSNLNSWADRPEHDPNIEDYAVVQEAGQYAWVVTDIVRDWYANANTGMLFKATDEVEKAKDSNSFKQFYSSEYTINVDYKPYLIIEFRNNNGTESYWDYTPSSAGRAGTGYVNNFTGNLTWIRNDIGFDGNRMPVSISHVYNLNDVVISNDTNNSNDTGGNSFGMGVGWRTNYDQRLYKWQLDGKDQDYYIWEDEDGTDHYFKLKDGKYKDEDGLELTLTVDGTGDSTYVITDKNDNTWHFDGNKKLKKIVNNQETKSEIEIFYNNNGFIEKIEDGADRTYQFIYDGGLLRTISYKGGKNSTAELPSINYDYDDEDRLVSVTSPDGEKCEYVYDENGLLIEVKDIDGYKLQYSYEKENGHESWQPYRVTSVKEYSGTTQGGELSFEYGHNQTVITDHNKQKKIIQFNDFGNPTCIQDGEGRAQFCEYAFNTDAEKGSNKKETAKGNQLLATSDLQYTTSSLLLDGSMFYSNNEVLDKWQCYEDSQPEITTESAYADTRVMKVHVFDNQEGGVQSESFSVPAKGTQTFSCFVKPKTSSVYLMAKCGEKTIVSEVEPIANAWRRMQITYNNESDSAQTVRYYILSKDSGYFYVDCVQVENAPIASRYNLITNGDFHRNATRWSERTVNGDGVELENAAPNDGAVALTTSAAPQLNNTVYRIEGSYELKKSLEQSVCIMGKEGDSLMLSGWAKGNSAPLDCYDGRGREFAIQCVLNYTDNTTDTFTARFNPDSDEWQYAATAISAKKEYRFVDIKLVYNYNVNTVYFDGIQLNKDEGSNTFTYDKDGNVVSAVNAQGEKTSYEYDSNNLTSEILPTGVELTYEYDENHNVKTATTQEGLVYTFTYDDYGNNTSVSISDGTKTMTSTAEYKDEGNLLKSTTDTLDNTTEYNYDSDTGVLRSVEPPKVTVELENGEKVKASKPTTYTYDDDMLRMTKATLENGDSEDDTLEVAYTYENDLLTEITTKTTKYTFGYGGFGLRTSVSAGERELATYTYSQDGNNYLEKLAYGNDDVIEYDYDSQGRVTKETYEDGDRVEYRYDTSGALASVYDSESGITSSYCYDLTDRLQKYLETSNQDDKYSVFLLYTYNEDNLISRVRENINGYSRLSKYAYTDDNKIKSFQKAYGYRYYNYDGFGRVIKTETKDHEDLLLTTIYDYNDPDNTATGQIESIRNTATGTAAPYDVTYSYTYDERGNITSVSDGTYTTSYAYDFANQLIREENEKLEKVWEWDYDNGGNIIHREEYDIADDGSTTLVDEVTYSYGDDEKWGDLLTQYNGTSIEYDEIGNPEAIRGWSMKWQHGRELASMSKDGVTWNHTYNADGLRIKRTDGNTTYTYVYDGGTLVRMTEQIGNDVNRLFFSHSPEGLPLSVVYKGVEYYYVTNVQGDVVALLDIDGNVVVEYTYDAWGNVTVSGTQENGIGKVNPLRYRGYVYDEETELYYVSSRYYDPEIGRFISSDTTEILTATPMGLTDKNLYAYCDNNPVIRADHGGDFWHIVAGAAIGGLIGGISSIVGQAVSGQKINWAEVGVSAASGALTGAITAACPGMGAVATGIVHGVVGAGTHVATELVNGRTPTVAGTLVAGVTSGVLAGGTKAIGNAISSGKLEIGKIKGVRASEGYPGVRYKTNAGPAYSVEFHSSHNGHTPHLQVNKWLYQYKGYEGQPYRFKSWHYEFFKPWKGVY